MICFNFLQLNETNVWFVLIQENQVNQVFQGKQLLVCEQLVDQVDFYISHDDPLQRYSGLMSIYT